MRLIVCLNDRAAQELSKSPIVALIGARQDKIRPWRLSWWWNRCESRFWCDNSQIKMPVSKNAPLLLIFQWITHHHHALVTLTMRCVFYTGWMVSSYLLSSGGGRIIASDHEFYNHLGSFCDNNINMPVVQGQMPSGTACQGSLSENNRRTS